MGMAEEASERKEESEGRESGRRLGRACAFRETTSRLPAKSEIRLGSSCLFAPLRALSTSSTSVSSSSIH